MNLKTNGVSNAKKNKFERQLAFHSKRVNNLPLKWIKEGVEQKQHKKRFPVHLLNDPIACREQMSSTKSVECSRDKL
jgi:hypothetical protein